VDGLLNAVAEFHLIVLDITDKYYP
jgi:hypothetical protein